MKTKDDMGREFDERPWGNFTVIDDDMFDHKVKRIIVAPSKRLSYQRHAKRAEHWFIVSGHATVVLDGFSCRLQAAHLSDVATTSSAELLAELIARSATGATT